MKSILISLLDQTIEVLSPISIASDIEYAFSECLQVARSPTRRITIRENGEDGFALLVDGNESIVKLTRGDLLTFIIDAVVRNLITDLSSAVALHAGAVGWSDKAVLLAGESGAGKSSLAAWFAANGFGYMTDEVVLLSGCDAHLLGFPRAIVLKPGAAEAIADLSNFQNAMSLTAGAHRLVHPCEWDRSPPNARRCGLVIFPKFRQGSDLRVCRLSAADTLTRLFGCNLNARNLPDGGFRAIAKLARSAPAISLQYGGYIQLDGTLDVIARMLLDDKRGVTPKFLSMLPREMVDSDRSHQRTKFPIPAPTPHKERRKLTIGMATYDDYDGVYFSLQAVRMYHPEILDHTNFLVIDNNPDGSCARPLKDLENHIENYRYVPHIVRSGTAVRDAVFAEAGGEFVVCMDCHVFIVPGALARLLDYLDEHSTSLDLLQGPLVFDDLTGLSTHFQPEWREGMYGFWATDERGADPDAPPFDIPMQGLGLFACRRAVWPGFNPHFMGFGGEEGYIHEKFRRRGGRTLCLPFLRWLHRFNRPMGPPYRSRWEDRIRNYVLGFSELGIPTTELKEHFRRHIGAKAADAILYNIDRELLAAASPTSLPFVSATNHVRP
jgi:hypothetical protein